MKPIPELAFEMASRDIEVFPMQFLSPENSGHPLYFPGWTWIFIRMNDCLQAAARLGQRCTISENVQPHGREGDLTSLIAAARAAACHMESEHRRLTGEGNMAWMGWTMTSGTGPMPFQITGLELPRCAFADDTLLTIGTVQLYLRRNVQTALEWIQARRNKVGEFSPI